MTQRMSTAWIVGIVIGVVGFCLVTMAVSGFVVWKFRDKFARNPNRGSSTAAAPRAIEYHSAAGRYSATFLGPPAETTTSVPLEGKPPATMHTVQWGNDVQSFTISHICYDDNQIGAGATLEAVLESGRDGMVQNVGGQLLRQATIDQQGNPGIDMWIQLPDARMGVMRGRTIMAGRCNYVLALVGVQAIVDRSIESFRLDPPTESFSLPHREAQLQ
ncbi:MAG: hypothetical protein IPK60_15250 [Sandaracinaceae bacterium]|jgi:hypothetical protein|nr:hypothetical protein [Sandaracinaceae bacterium]